MFEQDYNALYESEKEEFRRIANYILSKTFIIRDVYDKQAKKMITSSEYLFMEKYYDIFENYFNIAGWKLNKEPVEGLYYIENIYGQNKAKFDSFTTYILLSLMITYEETAPITTLGNSVITTTYDVISKMQILGLITKKPSKEQFRVAFRRLEQFNVILRLNTSSDVELWKIMIMPSIHHIIDYDKLKELCEYIPSFMKEKYEKTSTNNEVNE
ncbi:MAG: DUF4194 domain-containing protein [Erysipelotrichaceae bacterium]|nr:DUF4194 domain-containing protein [Erysipelotrichaceae bacterium]